MHLLPVITVLVTFCSGTTDVCEDYVSVSSTGSGTSDGIFSSTTDLLTFVTLKGSFYDHEGSYPDALVGLEFEFTDSSGGTCTECSWALSGSNLGSATSTDTVTIPVGNYLVSWQQSLSSDSAVLMGITLTLDDGSTLELGTIGPNSEAVQYLGGPIHGIKWTYDEVITST